MSAPPSLFTNLSRPAAPAASPTRTRRPLESQNRSTTPCQLRAGSLTVQLSLENGALRRVTLPQLVPVNLDAGALAEIMARLAAFPVSFEHATAFQRVVWERMREIPWGCAMTYRDLSIAVGSPRAMRAVGQACASNPFLLIVPCHRVLGEHGLGGFGYGETWKRTLLELESERVLA